MAAPPSSCLHCMENSFPQMELKSKTSVHSYSGLLFSLKDICFLYLSVVQGGGNGKVGGRIDCEFYCLLSM